ncbi:MAG: IS200/IS605 family element transposase accessory protein TnpB [Clostridia bacterium]|nr:IS200/IS605 family element transposase accessory protein TnpB [Clostridia bacterium]
MKTYSFKLYHAKRNKKLHRAINISGNIYNHCIALHKRYYRMYGKHLNMYKLQRHITKLKKTDKFSFWNMLGSQAIQDITQRIDRGYRLFFRNLKQGIRTAPPSFKKVRKYKSFTLKQAGFKLGDDNHIKIMGQGYRYHKSREIEGKIKIVTIKRDPLGDIYIYLVCETEEATVKPRSGKSVGLDFGLGTFLTTSDGNKIESPLFFKEGSKEIRKLNRSLSRKKKGSANRKRARFDLARGHKRIANRRRDFHFKLAKELSEAYSCICIEDLNLKGMQRLWGKKVSDLGFADFVRILEHQCHKTGTELIKIDRYYPSSKTCSSCGHVLEKLSLSTRTWTCPDCKAKHDRDRNAAINIHRVGASTFKGEVVRPA